MKKRSFLTALWICVLLVGFVSPAPALAPNGIVDVSAGGGVQYVAPSAIGISDCSSWANACTLQTALSNAIPGNQIWVKAGVYYPGINRTDTFTLKNGVEILGGFNGTEDDYDERDWQANLTILSGDIDGNDINDDGNFIAETFLDIVGNNAYHVVTSDYIDSNGKLDGFVITAGTANSSSYPDFQGGGMLNNYGSPTLSSTTFSGNFADMGGGGMHNYLSNPTLNNIIFNDNFTNNDGGGMYNYSSSPILTDVTFYNNIAGGNHTAGDQGGGMYNYDNSNPTLANVTFINNMAGDHGGGMCNYNNSSPTLTNVTFQNNMAYGGGGMYNDSYTESVSPPSLTNVSFIGNGAVFGGGMVNYTYSRTTMKNVSFFENTATGRGGGMHNCDYSSPIVTNVTFRGNSANSGGGLSNQNNSNPELSNVIIYGNSATTTGPEISNIVNSTPILYYSDIKGCGGSGAWIASCGTDGDGNIDIDPLFVDEPTRYLHLKLSSPAIDAGNNLKVPANVTTDLDGNPRFVDIPFVDDTGNGSPPIVDMGAYEVQYYWIYLPFVVKNTP